MIIIYVTCTTYGQQVSLRDQLYSLSFVPLPHLDLDTQAAMTLNKII